MARSAEQIERDYALSIESSDPSWDTAQGPIKELFTVPLSGITARTEEEAENLRKLFSLNFDETVTEEEITQALNNYGSRPGEGTRSSHNQYFLRFTRPRENITIPVGTLVANNTGTLIYRTKTEVVMLASQADQYFNPTRKAYEISVVVEADGVGPEYALPAFRVQTILTPINGIDATENRAKSSQGLPTESTLQQAERLKTILLGLNLNTQGGIPKRILDALPTQVELVQVVTPADPEFNRVQIKPSIDIYVLGTLAQAKIETITASAGQDQIIPLKQPIISVASVIVNGTTSVGFSLIKDETSETGSSVRAVDVIKLDVPLSLNDVVEYTYTYNIVLENVQSLVFNDASESLFQTDHLIRMFKRPAPFITIELKTLTSYSFDEVSAAVRQQIQVELDRSISRDRLSPSELRDLINSNVSGIQSLRITKFRKDTGSISNIETIVLGLNEVTQYVEANVDIKAMR
jgi:uncharacterized protein YqfB (UPF0267 family)